ncbi:hypothetical protein ACQ4LK_24695, partial [Bacillus pumilus]
VGSGDVYKRQGYLVFNESQTPTVFALPPLPGYGFIYQEAAKTLDGIRLIAFDFIEADHRITQYLSLIHIPSPRDPLHDLVCPLLIYKYLGGGGGGGGGVGAGGGGGGVGAVVVA